MVESNSNSSKSAALVRTHEKIKTIVERQPNLAAGDLDLQSLSSELCKMDGRFNRGSVMQTIDVLFESAHSKVNDEHSKSVITNLRKLVSQVELDLYRPNPRYLDAFFFPNKENVKKIVKYIGMAKKELKICVFNLTNDDLAAAILERHKAGILV
jgi:hypothetical protein